MRFLEQVFLIAYRTVLDVRVLRRFANDFYHFIAAGAALNARGGIPFATAQHIAEHGISDAFVFQKAAGFFDQIYGPHDAPVYVQLVLGRR
jgi:hypothetical protein